MPEFGKRTSPRYAAAPSRSSSQPDVGAALAVIETGKLPNWTTAGPTKLILGSLLIAAALYFFLATYAGGVVRDLRLAGTWQAAYDMRATNGSCTRHNFVVTRCSAKIQSIADPNQPPVATDFLMLFSSGGGELLVPVRSTTDPSAVAIAYAADSKLLNRTLTFIGLTGVLALILIGLVSGLASGRYKGGAAHHALLDGLSELQRRAESMPPRATI